MVVFCQKNGRKKGSGYLVVVGRKGEGSFEEGGEKRKEKKRKGNNDSLAVYM